MIIQEYKKIQCIAKLEGEYKKSFSEIVEYYAPELPEKLVFDGSAYTLHDFNHHCIDIYRIISDVIIYPQVAYSSTGLSSKELYILNLAVLFHDIGMSIYLDSERGDHSRKSAEYIKEIYFARDSVFRKKSLLNENEVKALALIVMAHSDIKDGSIPHNENGLNNPELHNDFMAQACGRIRANFLACILRLADELDITVERLGNSDIELQLKNIKEQRENIENARNQSNELYKKQNFEEKQKKMDCFVESYSHWQNLHLFSSVYRGEGGDEVTIRINDDYIRQKCNEGDTYDHIIDNILKIFNKVDFELKNGLIKRINLEKNKLELQKMISIAKLKLISEIPEVNELIAKNLNCLNLTTNKNMGCFEKQGNDNLMLKSNPDVIDEKFQTELSIIVKQRHLLKVGHFLIDDNFCARDWIDTKEIVETKAIIDEIIINFIKHINTRFGDEENYLILGLDMEGAIIASRVAMALQKPFSYLIPAKEIRNNADKDVEVLTEKYEKYIIITDVIVTFETVEKVYKSIKNSSNNYRNLLQIYTIFYRRPVSDKIPRNKFLLNKTTCVNSEFTAELFKKSKCPYKNEQCFGLNRKIK